MKKLLALLVALCALLTLFSCTSIKAPEDLKTLLEERGGVVKLYSDSASFESILGYFEIENDGGITDILIADESKNNSDPRPLIVIYCNSKETTENVYTSARKSLSKISEFIGFGSIEKCKTLKADNTVLIGHAEMIELAKGGI